MKQVEIDIWWEISGDFDSYDSYVEIEDDKYETLLRRIIEYRDEIDASHEFDEFDGKEFTDACCYGDIYDAIQKKVDDEARDSIIYNCCCEEDVDNIDEYIETNYSYGFYLRDSFIRDIIYSSK